MEYLTRQAADARGAMAHTVRELGSNLGQLANAHPVITLATGAVGGALLGRVMASHHGHDGHTAPPQPSTPEPESVVGALIGDMARQMIPGLTATLLGLFQQPETTSDPPPSRPT